MNFLAHLYLSGDSDHVMVGNFIADSVKGKAIEAFPAEIQRGIRLHRFIDSYTDVHDETIKAIRLLKPFTGRYSSVAVDLVFDHILARDWSGFSEEGLSDFVERSFTTLDANKEFFPEKVGMMYRYMRRDNWLEGYATIKGIDWAFRGLSSRVKHENELDKGAEAISNLDSEFTNIFNNFLPDIKREVESWLTLGNG
jgi:acyl carrier protein phosphodiesterase